MALTLTCPFLTRCRPAYLAERYSERIETQEELSKHLNQKKI